MTIEERNRSILLRLFVILVVVHSTFGDSNGISDIQAIPHDSGYIDAEQQPISLIIVDDSAYEKRNTVNKFKSIISLLVFKILNQFILFLIFEKKIDLMINKDQPERFEDEGAREEQLFYIPRVASGKKRDILTLSGSRV